MGRDIHMFIIDKNYNVIAKDIFENWRNGEWFNNVTGTNAHLAEYNYFPRKYGWYESEPTIIPEVLSEYTRENGYFGFYRVEVADFLDWFDTCKPYLQAGWASKYTAWLIKNKGFIPEDLPKTKPKDCDEYEFVEYKNKYEGSLKLFKALEELRFNGINLKACTIIYCFDH